MRKPTANRYIRVLTSGGPIMTVETSATSAEEVALKTKAPHPELIVMRREFQAWRDKNERDKEANRELFRLLNRTKYRNDRIKAGLPVRDLSKHDIAPRQPGESFGDYQRRAHRLRQLSYRGRRPEDVRPRAKLSNMSDTEKAEHRRRLARERKRKSRALNSQEKEADAILTEAELEELAQMASQ